MESQHGKTVQRRGLSHANRAAPYPCPPLATDSQSHGFAAHQHRHRDSGPYGVHAPRDELTSRIPAAGCASVDPAAVASSSFSNDLPTSFEAGQHEGMLAEDGAERGVGVCGSAESSAVGSESTVGNTGPRADTASCSSDDRVQESRESSAGLPQVPRTVSSGEKGSVREPQERILSFKENGQVGDDGQGQDCVADVSASDRQCVSPSESLSVSSPSSDPPSTSPAACRISRSPDRGTSRTLGATTRQEEAVPASAAPSVPHVPVDPGDTSSMSPVLLPSSPHEIAPPSEFLEPPVTSSAAAGGEEEDCVLLPPPLSPTSARFSPEDAEELRRLLLLERKMHSASVPLLPRGVGQRSRRASRLLRGWGGHEGEELSHKPSDAEERRRAVLSSSPSVSMLSCSSPVSVSPASAQPRSAFTGKSYSGAGSGTSGGLLTDLDIARLLSRRLRITCARANKKGGGGAGGPPGPPSPPASAGPQSGQQQQPHSSSNSGSTGGGGGGLHVVVPNVCGTRVSLFSDRMVMKKGNVDVGTEVANSSMGIAGGGLGWGGRGGGRKRKRAAALLDQLQILRCVNCGEIARGGYKFGDYVICRCCGENNFAVVQEWSPGAERSLLLGAGGGGGAVNETLHRYHHHHHQSMIGNGGRCKRELEREEREECEVEQEQDRGGEPQLMAADESSEEEEDSAQGVIFQPFGGGDRVMKERARIMRGL
ncbi:hypothetical protein CSUI_002103 [Cystoisospora suis]|uniref:Uncharacterized protein n=1 Tax=Cystoisospora suis TaxID=483139 RepID=A0A2C6KJ33_9APIC|nr:hypothetical protein CSUI_002103 [Cystoisospora suis]